MRPPGTIAVYAAVAGLQVTHHELDKLREAEAQEKEAEQKERAMAARREVSATSYSRMLEVENTNRQEDAVDARSMEQAIDALSSLGVAEAAPVDKHPEK
jgi:hypothetical protein